LAGPPATPLSPHFLPGYIQAEPGRTGLDLEHGTFYPGGKKEWVLSYPGHDWLHLGMKKNGHIVSQRVDAHCVQVRSDSVQDFSFVRDADRFSTVTKHLNDNYLRPGASATQPDIQKEIPPAGLSGLYFL